MINELALLRRSVEDMRNEQRRLEANLQAEFQLRDMLAASGSSQPEAAITPLNLGWQLSSQKQCTRSCVTSCWNGRRLLSSAVAAHRRCGSEEHSAEWAKDG